MPHTLLERLRGTSRRLSPRSPAEDRPDWQIAVDQALLKSVLDNLRHVLNSRRDMANACPDYGLPDPEDLIQTMPEITNTVCEMIRATIAKFEPRLAEVVVTKAKSPDPLTAAFSISARLIVENGYRTVKFDTELAASGRVDVDGQ